MISYEKIEIVNIFIIKIQRSHKSKTNFLTLKWRDLQWWIRRPWKWSNPLNRQHELLEVNLCWWGSRRCGFLASFCATKRWQWCSEWSWILNMFEQGEDHWRWMFHCPHSWWNDCFPMTLNNDVEQDDCLLKGRCVDVDCTHFHKLFLLFPSQGLRGFQNA